MWQGEVYVAAPRLKAPLWVLPFRILLAWLFILLWLSLAPAAAAPVLPSKDFDSLVWLVENEAGRTIDSRHATQAVNPASVVKVATTLWAMERLGPDYRFETRFYLIEAGGSSRPAVGLLVHGGADPDFHLENAFLLARALNERGVTEIVGSISVDERFWIGWEGGSARRIADTVERGLEMGRRLRRALDRSRWRNDEESAWRSFAKRHGLDSSHPPRLKISGGIAFHESGGNAYLKPDPALLLIHSSQPLASILKRFNVFSNNDIERLEAKLGSPAALAEFIRGRIGEGADIVSFETLSGLGHNRLSLRGIVSVLRALLRSGERLGYEPADVLPVMGCGSSTLSKLFPWLHRTGKAAGLTAKTGSLVTTDGGVAALAGYIKTARGPRLFAVVAPHSGRELSRARQLEEKWLSRMLDRDGMVRGAFCGAQFSFSDTDAAVRVEVPGH